MIPAPVLPITRARIAQQELTLVLEALEDYTPEARHLALAALGAVAELTAVLAALHTAPADTLP